MAASFFERLEARCCAIDSLLCVGLDPHPEDLRDASAEAARDFCLNLINKTADFAAAFKPNSAFFEIYGADGIQALQAVIAAVPEDIPVILDAKRGDIGSTATAYAKAAFETLGAGAVTVNPLLGSDAIAPFLGDPRSAIFLLCKTSNPGSAEFQDLVASGRPFYEHVAERGVAWNSGGNVGLVVGATNPDMLSKVRSIAPELWFLCPGAGIQGGDVPAAVSAGLRADGLGILIVAARSIARAIDPREAAKRLRDEINSGRTEIALRNNPFPNAQLADDLLRLGCVKFGDFTLKSGKRSPIYLDLRLLVGDPNALSRVANAYIHKLAQLRFDRIAGLPYAALPIATAISLQSGWPMIYPRKEAKDYGTGSVVEGPFEPGETAVVVDDLITTGGSKFEEIEKLRSAGLKVNDVIVLIDRQSNSETIGDGLLRLHSVFKLTELLDYWISKHRISRQDYETAKRYLQQG
ncbi:MAG: orotidine-5'-phosphate decarboxylase [Anaerolineales bacterium]